VVYYFINLEFLIILESYALRVNRIRIVYERLNLFDVNLTVTMINEVLYGELVGGKGMDDPVRSLPG
jgi:hypothetical protein